MKLEHLFEKSAVIKKTGFAVLQTALSTETPDNMQLHGAEACLLMSMSEMIRQQTGLSIDRYKLVQDLNGEMPSNMDTWYVSRKYHHIDEIIKQLMTKGAKLYNSRERARFNLKLHVIKSVADMKACIDDGISIVCCWQNTSNVNDLMDVASKGDFRRMADQVVKDGMTLDQFKKHVEDLKGESYRSIVKSMDDAQVFMLAQGIVPYVKSDDPSSSYHGVLAVGYDHSHDHDVFIIKDIRDKYLRSGMIKMEAKYFEELLGGATDEFFKAVIGIEAERISAPPKKKSAEKPAKVEEL